MRHVRLITDRLRALSLDLAWAESPETNVAEAEMLDAFVARFGRLQDTFADHYCPNFLCTTGIATWIFFITDRFLENRLERRALGSPVFRAILLSMEMDACALTNWFSRRSRSNFRCRLFGNASSVMVVITKSNRSHASISFSA